MRSFKEKLMNKVKEKNSSKLISWQPCKTARLLQASAEGSPNDCPKIMPWSHRYQTNPGELCPSPATWFDVLDPQPYQPPGKCGKRKTWMIYAQEQWWWGPGLQIYQQNLSTSLSLNSSPCRHWSCHRKKTSSSWQLFLLCFFTLSKFLLCYQWL